MRSRSYPKCFRLDVKRSSGQYRIPSGGSIYFVRFVCFFGLFNGLVQIRSEEHTSELQSRGHLVCRLLLEKKNKTTQLLSQAPTKDTPRALSAEVETTN